MKRFVDFLIEATMSAPEALKILGLQSNFTDADLKAAYKQAALANHPDKGGMTLTMQRINAAREVLLHLANRGAYRTNTSTQHDHDDDDERTPPHPQMRDIIKTDVFELFRKNLKAEVFAVSAEIRVPIPGAKSVDTTFMIIINRAPNNLGVEYVVKGIGQLKPGIGMKMIMRFSNENDDMVFWESKQSVKWVIGQLQDILSSATHQNSFNVHEIKAALKEYKKNMERIDSNLG